MERINKKAFEGKTIKSMDTNAVNCVTFHFTDGTKATLEVQAVLPTLHLYGIAQQEEQNAAQA